MRINPDTKDALLFTTGLLGIVAQGVLAAFGIDPSLALIGAYLAMCGIATASSIYGGRPFDNIERPDDRDEPPPPAPRRKRKARRDAAAEKSDGK